VNLEKFAIFTFYLAISWKVYKTDIITMGD